MKHAFVATIFALMLAFPVVGSSTTNATTDVTKVASLNSVTGNASFLDFGETVQHEITESLNARPAKPGVHVETEANHSSDKVYRGAGYLQPGVEIFGSSTAPDASIATLDVFSVAPNGLPKPSTAIVMMLGLGGIGVINHTRRASRRSASE